MKTRSLSVCLLLLSLLFSGWTQAVVELNEDVPETYIVKKGDTLWGISGMYLKEPWLWPELWDANPQIDNPHLIYPGDELHLVWVDGRPRLRLNRGRDVKLTPNMRVSPLDLAIPVIPMDQIGPWLVRNRVMDAEEVNSSAYIVAGDERRLISGPGDRIFGRGPFPDGERAYGIYQVGQNYLDPVTKEFLGYQVRDVGSAKLLSSNRDDVTELEITRITEEVLRRRPLASPAGARTGCQLPPEGAGTGNRRRRHDRRGGRCLPNWQYEYRGNQQGQAGWAADRGCPGGLPGGRACFRQDCAIECAVARYPGRSGDGI